MNLLRHQIESAEDEKSRRRCGVDVDDGGGNGGGGVSGGGAAGYGEGG